MKKILLTLIALLISNQVLAADDYEVWTGEYKTKYVYIKGLQEDLLQQYYIKDSKGPAWGQDAEFLADVVHEDFYERHTYWSERGYPRKACPKFTEDDFMNATESGYGLTWQAVKKIEGSKKTVFYLGSFTITIEAGRKTCSYIQNTSQKYVFLNKLNNGVPVYLGHLSDSPPVK